MRTTIRINDEFLKQTKKRAADEGRVLTSLVEDGLAFILAKLKTSSRKRVDANLGEISTYFTISKSPGFQLLSNQGCNGS
jgi:hypothetical protein